MVKKSTAGLIAKSIPSLSTKEIAQLRTYTPQHKVRYVTATALFDGHDASINIMRRLLQARGAEVVHLGHNRTAQEVVDAAIQEDVQAVALSSYQGGHVEYFRYVRELLDQAGGKEITIFGGGGGVITPQEIADLEEAGVTKIYSPEDGQLLGLEGMIGHMLLASDFLFSEWGSARNHTNACLARALTLLEQGVLPEKIRKEAGPSLNHANDPIVLGITGTGGAGKSSLVDELMLRFLQDFAEIRIGLICVDPSKKKTGGALLGDRIRVNACADSRIFLRSFASRGSGRELAKISGDAVALMKNDHFDLIVVETSGIGQGDTGILDVCDVSLYVMTPEYGASSQLEKIDMLDYADLIAINKYERRQGPDALRDIRSTLRRSRFGGVPKKDDEYNVFATIASRFNDDGVNGLYRAIVRQLATKDRRWQVDIDQVRPYSVVSTCREAFIPPARENYLAEISQAVRGYHAHVASEAEKATNFDHLTQAGLLLQASGDQQAAKAAESQAQNHWQGLAAGTQELINGWSAIEKKYEGTTYTYRVRNKDVEVESRFSTLASRHLPKVSLPKFSGVGDRVCWRMLENLPGSFPYTAGLFPFRRQGEDPKRQFAGEGGPGRTNKRFHYLSRNDQAKRLSTAFDSVTLYGSDPDKRPDIYGKVGESGVSIAHLEDMKLLYSGFDLCHPNTSVSMTINGPAPIILAMFLNTAIDQQVDRFAKDHGRSPSDQEYRKLYDDTLQTVRGTVQADILKEDQAQNTCIFSTEFALKMMGDIQEYFIAKKVRNYYGVSISGYHIAEAGANPITQLAFTLANGFTYVEYYLSRGFAIDDFAPNLSFFFSNGLDAEYAVLGRVARRIWAIAMRDLYGANETSQRLKYHIQTSGRSLHAQEIDFNDIRTTLQALMALSDNCNSLHTNAHDEALTTPTEASVRRAMAIQMIINRELGSNKCENINQGSFFIEELTNLVEEAVLAEFDSISRRGGVLGAMETQYQRSKIQEESLYYEHLKHSGELPIIGVNTYRNDDPEAEGDREEVELIRSTYEEKDDQLTRLRTFQSSDRSCKADALGKLKRAATHGDNLFAELMQTVRTCSLGEISQTLFEVGGKYRRSM